MSKSKTEQIVIITGDIAMDWNLARTRRSKGDTPFWSADDTTSTSWQRGGGALLADLIEAIAKDLQRSGSLHFSIRQTGAPHKSSKVHPDNGQYHHSYAIWSLFKYGEKPAWRVEEFLGLDRADSDPVQDWQKVVDDTPEADLVVLDDADLGFRNHPELWPMALDTKGKGRPWILLKMARPLAQGPLWEHLHRNYSDRLIAVATVDDLRLSEVQISRELSWERTAQDVFWELVHNPCVNSLSHCAHVVISFGPAGAILLSRQEGKDQPTFQCSLFFDPKGIERMWEKDYPGGMIGYNTCLAAGLARQLMVSQPDIQSGIQSGLAAMRTLHLEGYGEWSMPASQANLVFPIDKIAATLAQPAKQFAVAPVQDPMRFIQQTGEQAGKPVTEGFWTILQDTFKSGLDQVAMQVVLEGPEAALLGVPWGQFGDLLTVDRQEIESYRSIRNLVAEYVGQKQAKRPLSIAVFGPPGSGKSFGITQVAKSLRPDEIKEITFNLSQFDSIEKLASAFHQVRDLNLTGKIPLVFWDEFDSVVEKDKFGWLRYFLAPMQDGQFMEGQILHPLGKAIFVFAGGVCHSIEDFVRESEGLRDAKAPDFISRLRGYVNILGANPPETSQDKNVSDPFYLVRRAILLRSILWRNAPQVFENRNSKGKLNIDNSVLRAILKTRQYKHGARSMEAVIGMSNLAGKARFDQSSLPSEAQLDLHVDGQDFLSLVHEIVLEGEMLERLAAINHDIYCEGMREKGFSFGEERDDVKKTRPLLRLYAEIPESYQESNRNAVRSISENLKNAGYIMIQARSNEPPFDFPGADLDQLAEIEHDRYMRDAISQGWRYGPESSEKEKTNPTLLPWRPMTEEEIQLRYPDFADKVGRTELSDEEKQKDRVQVKGYPEILKRAGYTIVKLRRSKL
jgi:hypothetical protein